MSARTLNRRILFVGCDKGAWQIRGDQLAGRLRAKATSKPKADDWSNADTIVLVKRAAHRFAHEARQSGRTLVWDVLDVWFQPADNRRSVAELALEVQHTRAAVGIEVLIGATQAMADDIGGIYLPHHSRDGLAPTPVREKAAVVAYEGSPRYLGTWRDALKGACKQLKLAFVVNPPDLSEADIIVSFRDSGWDGELCRRWKSGVKLVNAIAVGRPVLAQFSAAFHEIHPPGTIVEQQDHLVDALRQWLPADRRQEALEACRQLAPAFTIDAIAERYRQLLRRVS